MPKDIIIIGGGPAGLMAACRALELGAKVLVVEKNFKPGIKLLTTGGGRCNLSHFEEDSRELAQAYGSSGAFLLSAFSKFGVQEVIDFFEKLNVKIKVEKNNKVFPASDRAQDILQALTNYILDKGGEIMTDTEVTKIIKDKNKIDKIILSDGRELIASNYILATGGKSYPLTGSTGDGYKWLKELGHKIIKPRPGLAPIIIKERLMADLEGLSLSEVSLTLFSKNKKIAACSGDIIFTAQGISGPAALNLSSYINDLSPDSLINLDFFPDLSEAELDIKLQEIFQAKANRDFKNILSELLKPKLVPVILKLSALSGDKKANSITKLERQNLTNLLKRWPLNILKIESFNKAMITVGGLDLKEVDPKTMHSKLISNLFLAGELLDLNGPTGGYNLQICWSTGYVAGEEAV